jgi:hypothetical protein
VIQRLKNPNKGRNRLTNRPKKILTPDRTMKLNRKKRGGRAVRNHRVIMLQGVILMKNDVAERLKSLGYETTANDEFALMFLISKVENTIKNECNVDGIPDGLHQIAVDMVCGEFLQAKQANGQLDESEINTEAAIKSIKEGDTQITYAIPDGGGSGSLDALINYLMNYGRSQFITFRKFRW